MVLFKWSKQLSVGVFELDEEHQQLFIMLNALHAATKEKNRDQELGQLLDDTLHYLKQHFLHEETLMLHQKFPGYMAHKNAHKNFFEQIGNYKEQMNVNNPFICNQILQLLRNGITPHIYSLDKQYVPFLAPTAKATYKPKESLF